MKLYKTLDDDDPSKNCSSLDSPTEKKLYEFTHRGPHNSQNNVEGAVSFEPCFFILAN